MKTFYLLLLFLSAMAYGQNGENIPVKVSGVDFNLRPGDNNAPTEDKDITSFSVNYALKKDYKLKITGPNNKEKSYEGGGEKLIDFEEVIYEKSITIKLLDKTGKVEKTWLFIISANTAGGNADGNTETNNKKQTFDDKVKGMLPKNNFSIDGLTQTPFGYVDKDRYIHIFLDYRGNNLVTTIPQGIANAQYIVHVYSKESNKPNAPVYTIRQTAGSFDDAFNFRNNNAKIELQNEEWTGKVNDDQFQLSTSTGNITFELVAVTKDGETFQRTTIETYTIKMTPTYHGSFDIGFVNSELASPAYTLVNTPDGSAQTVKAIDNGKSQGVTTLMATFYYSPIIILEDLYSRGGENRKKVPFYKKKRA